MTRSGVIAFFLCLCTAAKAQDSTNIQRADLERILSYLAADSLKGRGNFTPELEKAGNFIANEFKQCGLAPLQGNDGYFQPFILENHGSYPAPHGKVDSSAAYVRLRNIVGILPGKTRPEEIIIFSAHYDHLGLSEDNFNQVMNGANDDASGTTAVMLLAKYYSALANNDRTLVFCAFAGEELGLYGSSYFASRLDPQHFVMDLNIEMIGRHDYRKSNCFFLTGTSYSSLAKIFKQNLINTGVKLVGEPSLEKDLFRRSDNFSLVKRGIVAHSFMSSDDSEPCYHSACDDFNRMDINNMLKLIQTIPVAMKTIVNGNERPEFISKNWSY